MSGRARLTTPLIVLAAVFFFLCGEAWADWNVKLIQGRRFVPLSDVTTFYRLNPPQIDGSSFTLTGQGRTLKGRAGTREIFINNVKYVLCFDIETSAGDIYISAMDVTKIIEPVMRPGKIKDASAVRTVVLDAGHGGHDSGAKGPLGVEKEAALDVVKRAKRLLEQNGYNVRLTRGSDVFIPLEKRPALANKYPSAIFISVHFNKSKSSSAEGIETFALAPRGVPSMDEENLSYSDLKVRPGNAQDEENIALATAIHSSKLRHLQLFDRGIKRARFAVLRHLQIPGVLVEGGFMGNPGDARKIASQEFREAFARAILEGVQRYSSAISGRMRYFQPSAVVAATDPTDAPEIRREIAPTPRPTPTPPVGSRTPLSPAVEQATGVMMGSGAQ